MSSALASLPQQDPNSTARQAYLAEMRELYAYQYSYNNTLATVVKLPKAQKPDSGYKRSLVKRLASQLPAILTTKVKLWLKTPIKHYDDYLFWGRDALPDADLLGDFLSDKYFGLQRAIGINHVILQRASEQNPLPVNLALNRIQQVFTQIVENITFDAALQNQRLYYVDYAMLQGLAENPGEFAGHKQYVTAPIVLLYRQDEGTLKPVAIQLNQIPSETNPVFTPLDASWTTAKLYAQIADANYQGYVSHITHIHYVVEAFTIATYRELHKTHPVFLLLQPHLRYTLNINEYVKKNTTPDGEPGYFGRLLGGHHKAMFALVADAFKAYDFTASMLPTDISQRQVDDLELFYPYAAEGKQIWDMTQQFIQDYVALYYPDVQTLAEDTEIQNWARLMAAEDGMRIKGFPVQFETVEQLAQALTQIIFTTTAKHSSVHYPQYLFAGYIPAMPFAAYAPAPTQVDTQFTTEDLLKILPPRDVAFAQARALHLTNFRYGCIGEQAELESKAQPLVARYKQQLDDLAQQLTEAEKNRPYPYIFLNPRYIPNSVMV